jgi:hypothetical protein
VGARSLLCHARTRAGVILAFATIGTALSSGRILERGTITIKGARAESARRGAQRDAAARTQPPKSARR